MKYKKIILCVILSMIIFLPTILLSISENIKEKKNDILSEKEAISSSDKNELNPVYSYINSIKNERNKKKVLYVRTLDELKTIDSRVAKLIKDKDLDKIPSEEELNEIGNFYNLPDKLLYALMMKDSQGRNHLISKKNAKGAFQFIKSTAIEFNLIETDSNKKIIEDHRTNPWLSADASARYLSWIFNHLTPELSPNNIDNYKYTLAGYNAGISKVKIVNGNRTIPNYSETKDYINKITEFTKGNLYLVKKGETLEKIAKKVGVDHKTISKLNNNIKNINLKYKSFILINDKKPLNDYVSYIIRKGDTLHEISNYNKDNLNLILSINNIKSDIIITGQTIKIPKI
jgi:LysM repeat protein